MTSVFTKIIDNQLPAFRVYEDEYVLGFLSLDAIRHGHTLLVPKLEVDYFVDVPEPHYSAVFRAARPLAKAIHEVTGCVRVGTVIAGWDIPHFHYHLIPMFEYHDLDPRLAKRYPAEDDERMAQKIRAALRAAPDAEN